MGRNRDGTPNHRLCRGLRKVIDGMLLPLDERFPIQSVVLSSD